MRWAKQRSEKCSKMRRMWPELKLSWCGISSKAGNNKKVQFASSSCLVAVKEYQVETYMHKCKGTQAARGQHAPKGDTKVGFFTEVAQCVLAVEAAAATTPSISAANNLSLKRACSDDDIPPAKCRRGYFGPLPTAPTQAATTASDQDAMEIDNAQTWKYSCKEFSASPGTPNQVPLKRRRIIKATRPVMPQQAPASPTGPPAAPRMAPIPVVVEDVPDCEDEELKALKCVFRNRHPGADEPFMVPIEHK